MPLMNRRGVGDELDERPLPASIRVNDTAPAGPSAFFEMKRRPRRVAAQRVDVSLDARPSATTYPPVLSVPYGPDAVRSLGELTPPWPDGSPSGTKSPQV